MVLKWLWEEVVMWVLKVFVKDIALSPQMRLQSSG